MSGRGRGRAVVTKEGGTVALTDGSDAIEMDEEEAERVARRLIEESGAEDVLLEAWAVGARRGEEYGSPLENMGAIANRWGLHMVNAHGRPPGVDPVDVPLMMIDLKLARMETGAVTRDGLVDIAGYARVAAVLEGVNGE